ALEVLNIETKNGWKQDNTFSKASPISLDFSHENGLMGLTEIATITFKVKSEGTKTETVLSIEGTIMNPEDETLVPFEKNTVTVEIKSKDNTLKDLKFNKYLIIFIIIVLAIASTILDGFYTVGEQEQAVITMFGNIVRTDTAGLYFKIPWLQKCYIVDMTTHGTGIGYRTDKQGRNITLDSEGIMITSDFNLVNVDFYLEYKVSDPIAYLYQAEQPENILRNMILACIRDTVVNFTVDDVITTGKSQIQAEVKDKLAKMLSEYNIGLQCVNLTVQDAAPPTREIVQAFKEVETAKQSKETTINGAKKYQSEQLPLAEAKADQIIQKAEAVKQSRISEAQGQAARFNNIYNEYQAFPLITKQRLFYETLEEILPNMKVIITDGKTQNLMPLNKF
ncbi:MAG: FtsH protease activity modulator HflK, partial [Synergistaceae bacterium]|nr:FtsH protease activity modulator HflK [Synergistaceae bacterium]